MFACHGKRALTSRISRHYSSILDHDFASAVLHLLHLSSLHYALQLTRQSHAQILSTGFSQHPFLVTKLVSAYAINGRLDQSRFVFDSVSDRTTVLWNSLINGFVKNHRYVESVALLNEMCRGSVLPDEFTFATISKACGVSGELQIGKVIHGRVLQLGFVSDIIVSNSLISMYNSYGELDASKKMFDEMSQRDISSWNNLLSAYVNSLGSTFTRGLWDAIRWMQSDGFRLNGFTISILLPLSTIENFQYDYGRELHCYVVKNGLDLSLASDVHLGCCLIDMYAKSNRISAGRKVFEQMERRNIYVWTSIINGYVLNGDLEKALSFFRKMQIQDRLEPNRVSILTVLPTCDLLLGLIGGKQIHGFAIRRGFNSETPLSNALIDIYAKCGSLIYAENVFKDASYVKDTISWSTMISVYGSHGKGKEAIILFDQMLKFGNKPDVVTIVNVLSACGRCGLVEEGLKIYNQITDEYQISPTMEICACVVDLLGRIRKLEEAMAFIKRMPIKPGPSVWGSLVNSCMMHGNYKMQELAYRSLLELEPENPSNYVSLSNFHANSRRWDIVGELRREMKKKGMIKTPGCSWINIYGQTHGFYVADEMHPLSNQIYRMLNNLIIGMIEASYSNELEGLI